MIDTANKFAALGREGFGQVDYDPGKGTDAEGNRAYDFDDLTTKFNTALRRVRVMIGYVPDDRAERIALEIAKATARRA